MSPSLCGSEHHSRPVNFYSISLMTHSPPTTVISQTTAPRLVSLDAYRGLVMLFMASSGLGFAKIAHAHPDSAFWQIIAFHTSHAIWLGGGAWDMIQPSFMLMVGMSLPYSLSRRLRDGEAFGGIFAHTLWRSFVLIALAVFLTTGTKKQPDFTFPNVLAQIGLGYPFVFLLANRGLKIQITAIVSIALGVWAAFAMYPLPADLTNLTTLGVSGNVATQAVLPGFFGHWSMNVNFAANFDRWFLNLFPRESAFVFNAGGYQTLNFIPAIITMSLGLLAGEALRSERSETQKLKWLVVSGGVCVGLGVLAGATVCPIIKRIWTPSWALYSGGIVLWAVAFFYWVIDIRGWKAWSKPLVVVGMNSIAIYVAHSLLGGWLRSIGRTYLGGEIFDGAYGPFWSSLFVLAALWLMCLWLYCRKIFLKI